MRMGDSLARIGDRLGVPLVYKSSFDKANRTAGTSPRGLGLDASLKALELVRSTSGLPVTTDVHECWQVGPVADVVDLVQIPAFLCRQTDLLVAAGASGRPVNIKKGQFASAAAMGHAAAKVRRGALERGVVPGGLLLTERGTTFGYDDLVVDARNIPRMREAAPGCLVVVDATHAVQSPPAGSGVVTGGARRFVPTVARVAAAAGADGIFMETHDQPHLAISDSAVQWPLDRFECLARELLSISRAASSARDEPAE